MSIRLLIILLCLALTTHDSIAQRRTSTLVACKYNEKKDQTEYQFLPLGATSIPGRWTKENYNKSSKQQFFSNEEGVWIAIAFAPIDNFEFNIDKSKKGFEFVRAFYAWEDEYFRNTYDISTEVIESNEELKYIIWRAYDVSGNKQIDTYFLLAEQNGYAHNYSISITNVWSSEKKIQVLKKMYGL